MDSNKSTTVSNYTDADTIRKLFDPTSKEHRVVQNFLLVWLNLNTDESNQDYHSSIVQLRAIVNIIRTFNDVDQCIDFLTDIKDEKVFMIVSCDLGQHIVPLVHNISQLYFIYVHSESESYHEQWMTEWSKVKGVFTRITHISESLKQTTRQCDQNCISMSFLPSSDNILDQLDQSFMYTQLLKEILFEIEYDQQSVKDVADYCREQYDNNHIILQNIDKFEREYHLKSPIWWYTYEFFLYTMLNRALRIQEIDTIIDIRLFVRDLHRNIEQLHLIQSNNYQGQSFIVYRGQAVSNIDFTKMKYSLGGLLSFNNFLSTSLDRAVSLAFAESNGSNNPDLTVTGVLFEMTVDPSISTAPFAFLDTDSYYQDSEQEVLFSMHTIFRIKEINQIDNDNRLWCVKLTLTNDNDQQLKILTERMREETDGSTEWHRLGQLLMKLGEFDKAQQVFTTLVRLMSDEHEKAFLFGQLGCIKNIQGDYTEAILFYKRTIEIYEENLTSNHLTLVTYYNNIGSVYGNMGEYSEAISFYKKALDTLQNTLSSNHSELVISYKNIASMHKIMGEYAKALPFYQQALEIEQKTLPPNHPDLATSHSNVGSVFQEMGEYWRAFSFFEKALDIRQKVLPPFHPDLAVSYTSIGCVYKDMGEYSKALPLYDKALEIYHKILAPNHPDLALVYNDIGRMYHDMREYSNALMFYEKALEIWQKTLSPDHINLATAYNNIGLVYCDMDEHSKSLPLYEKALEIYRKVLPPNHSLLATSHNNVGLMYSKMGEYSEALSSYEKVLEIYEQTLSAQYPDFASFYSNIGSVYYKMGEYLKAVLFFECAMDIAQHSLPPNHSLHQVLISNIEIIKEKL